MKTHLISSIRLTLVTLLLFGIIYPLAITGIARLTAANGGKGETISADGKIYGFEVIGQSFVQDKYFNGRPSAVGYNAAATGGSNKGPSNPEYLAQVEQRISSFLEQNPDITRADVTVEMVTASGGGLDPHISPEGAAIQIPRISKVRGISSAELERLIDENTEQPLLKLFGTPRVNVLKLNLALDALKEK